MPAARRYTRTERAAIVQHLAETARENGGTPVWARVAKAHGVDRKTLKGWWAKSLHLISTPATPDPAEEGAEITPFVPRRSEQEARRAEDDAAMRLALIRARELLEMDKDAFRLEVLAELICERGRTRSDGTRAQLTIRMLEMAQELRPSADEGTMDMDEIKAVLRSLPLDVRRDLLAG